MIVVTDQGSEAVSKQRVSTVIREELDSGGVIPTVIPDIVALNFVESTNNPTSSPVDDESSQSLPLPVTISVSLAGAAILVLCACFLFRRSRRRNKTAVEDSVPAGGAQMDGSYNYESEDETDMKDDLSRAEESYDSDAESLSDSFDPEASLVVRAQSIRKSYKDSQTAVSKSNSDEASSNGSGSSRQGDSSFVSQGEASLGEADKDGLSRMSDFATRGTDDADEPPGVYQREPSQHISRAMVDLTEESGSRDSVGASLDAHGADDDLPARKRDMSGYHGSEQLSEGEFSSAARGADEGKEDFSYVSLVAPSEDVEDSQSYYTPSEASDDHYDGLLDTAAGSSFRSSEREEASFGLVMGHDNESASERTSIAHYPDDRSYSRTGSAVSSEQPSEAEHSHQTDDPGFSGGEHDDYSTAVEAERSSREWREEFSSAATETASGPSTGVSVVSGQSHSEEDQSMTDREPQSTMGLDTEHDETNSYAANLDQGNESWEGRPESEEESYESQSYNSVSQTEDSRSAVESTGEQSRHMDTRHSDPLLGSMHDEGFLEEQSERNGLAFDGKEIESGNGSTGGAISNSGSARSPTSTHGSAGDEPREIPRDRDDEGTHAEHDDVGGTPLQWEDQTLEEHDDDGHVYNNNGLDLPSGSQRGSEESWEAQDLGYNKSQTSNSSGREQDNIQQSSQGSQEFLSEIANEGAGLHGSDRSVHTENSPGAEHHQSQDSWEVQEFSGSQDVDDRSGALLHDIKHDSQELPHYTAHDGASLQSSTSGSADQNHRTVERRNGTEEHKSHDILEGGWSDGSQDAPSSFGREGQRSVLQRNDIEPGSHEHLHDRPSEGASLHSADRMLRTAEGTGEPQDNYGDDDDEPDTGSLSDRTPAVPVTREPSTESDGVAPDRTQPLEPIEQRSGIDQPMADGPQSSLGSDTNELGGGDNESVMESVQANEEVDGNESLHSSARRRSWTVDSRDISDLSERYEESSGSGSEGYSSDSYVLDHGHHAETWVERNQGRLTGSSESNDRYETASVDGELSHNEDSVHSQAGSEYYSPSEAED